MEEYPEAGCTIHPDRLMEWDGYCYVCIECITEHPKVESQSITDTHMCASYCTVHGWTGE